jgi:FAD:protein FMN transferase
MMMGTITVETAAGTTVETGAATTAVLVAGTEAATIVGTVAEMTNVIALEAVHSAFGPLTALPKVASESRPLMGGTAEITIVGGSQNLLRRAFELATYCEELWSRFIRTSDISRLNWAGGKATEVDLLTVRLIRAMQTGYVVTNGDFDPTLLPDLIAAGYIGSRVDASRISSVPSTALSPGNVTGIRIDENVVTLGRRTTVDSGGVGKGLTADLICEFVMSAGAQGVMAEIAGDVVVAGRAPVDTSWHIGIEDPFATGSQLAVVRLDDEAVVTSSPFTRTWDSRHGVRHDLLNPRTGLSTESHVRSATVIARTGEHAAVLTKPAFLRDTDEYLGWLPSVGGAAMLVLQDGSSRTTSNWQDYL